MEFPKEKKMYSFKLDGKTEFVNVENFDQKYPMSTGSIEGLTVSKDISNTGSIRSTLDSYKVLSGIRIVPMSDFKISGKSYSISENDRIARLAEQIKESGEILNCLIIEGYRDAKSNALTPV
jgi:hypothetical protein